jgi:hypothetical protein
VAVEEGSWEGSGGQGGLETVSLGSLGSSSTPIECLSRRKLDSVTYPNHDLLTSSNASLYSPYSFK